MMGTKIAYFLWFLVMVMILLVNSCDSYEHHQWRMNMEHRVDALEHLLSK